jgi:hypothetical protein
VTDDGDVLTLTLDLGLADGEEVVGRLSLLRDLEGLAVKDLVLENDDGVGVTDGGLCVGQKEGERRQLARARQDILLERNDAEI